jgi:hypothetical protein
MALIETKDLPQQVQALLAERRRAVAEHFYEMADAEIAELGEVETRAEWSAKVDESSNTHLVQGITIAHSDPDVATLEGRVMAVFDDRGSLPRTIPFDMSARINPGRYGRSVTIGTVSISTNDRELDQAEGLAWNLYEKLSCLPDGDLDRHGLEALRTEAETYLKKVVHADVSGLAVSAATTLQAMPLGVARKLDLIDLFKQASDYIAEYRLSVEDDLTAEGPRL